LTANVDALALPSDGVRRIAILGGSTPFTIALFDAIAACVWADRVELVLHGRNVESMRLVEAYGNHRLEGSGWTVTAATHLDVALEGADLILHQIRYGGLQGRKDDERVAHSVGSPADETLGPGGLQSALRMAPAVRSLAEAISRSAPDALVLNLTNPLSAATAILAGSGLRCVGLCELPELTVERACSLLGHPIDGVEWDYTGLNHRGFVHRLSDGGRDLLDTLVTRLGPAGTIEGITGAEIAGLGALPLKYFALFRAAPPPTTGRADVVETLRAAILDELRGDSAHTPPSLGRRPMPWYPRTVVPLLASLGDSQPRRHVLDVLFPDGIVRELRAEVSSREIRPCVPWRSVPMSAEAARWHERFEVHERAVLAALAAPSREAVRGAVAVDPLTRPEQGDAAAAAIWGYVVDGGFAG
jgi:6-phospho-beta-glucosidase